MNAIFFPLSFRCFEFWDMGVCCNRNAFTKLSPYIHLKKDTENYIKYIDFSVEVKCLYSWHSNMNNPSSIPQLIAYIPMSTSKLTLLKELIFASQSHPVPSNEWAVYYFFFLFPVGSGVFHVVTMDIGSKGSHWYMYYRELLIQKPMESAFRFSNIQF